MVGDARSIELPDWGRIRAGRGRLRGFRCIHTHLDGSPLSREDITDLALYLYGDELDEKDKKGKDDFDKASG